MAKKPVIGLLGGGQLGRMAQEAAGPLGIEIVVLDAADCPFRQVSHNAKHVAGSFNDPDKIRELATKCDILTVEIEHVNTEILEEIATRGVTLSTGEVKKVPVHPSWETIRLIQDKYLQKEHFLQAGIPVAPQIAISAGTLTRESLSEVAESFGFPFMLKARKGSYDGRGNFEVRSTDDFDEAILAMGKLQLYAEKFVAFEKELAVMVVRTENDEGTLRNVHAYPAVQTIHEDSVCTKVFYPPRQVPADVSEKAKSIAANVVRTLKGRGIFAVEMFLLQDGSIVVNEVAPRPHNSGHLFIEAIPYMSQFKAHIYSILDIFPSSIKLTPRVSAAIMLNILGGASEDSHENLVGMTSSLYDEHMDVFLHLYGKVSKPGRKIGHITVTSYTPDTPLEQLAAPLIKQVNDIRQDRLDKASAQIRPSNAAPSSTSSRNKTNPLVIVTMGSDSDLPVLKAAFEVFEAFDVPYDFTITSAHRTPHRMVELGQSAAARGVRVLIAAAGGAAHLPGMLASETVLPVIGVPVKATHLDGQDSLLSIVQMPRGCPVATVGINNSTNAALLAVRILGCSDQKYGQAMAKYMKNMSDEVVTKAAKLEELGWEEYLAASSGLGKR
ncbi:hypothetical protein QQS21_003403 [Conoideocrella luteorostrata]|uniref:Phosphoribosylaminoimidazole carboxylase n=1 Tax=Conoideocrella luteorostrata TaxID=1105319 RepID=A0AAJ0CTE3_9HYPO|nr:hypothetical protein QQS21_003403 [Conoideocrella luteorostrata]